MNTKHRKLLVLFQQSKEIENWENTNLKHKLFHQLKLFPMPLASVYVFESIPFYN